MARNRRILKALAFLTAILIGVVVASYGRILPGLGQRDLDSRETITQQLPKTATSAKNPDTQARPVDAKSEDVQFFTGAGAVLRFAREGEQFIGFEVVDAGADSRLTVGNIIVAVNGMPVEDSAAGSELLLAALEDQGSNIDLKAVD